MKFFDALGFVETSETSPDIYEEVITERSYYGDVVKNTTRQSYNSNGTNPDYVISNTISILSDDYSDNHLPFLRYVVFKGARWVVSSVDIQRPRLNITLGGLYNGPNRTN